MWKKLTKADKEEIVKERKREKMESIKGESLIKRTLFLDFMGLVFALITAGLLLFGPMFWKYHPRYSEFTFKDVASMFPYILGVFLVLFSLIYFIYIMRILYLIKPGNWKLRF